MALQPLVSAVNSSRGFEWVKEDKRPNSLLKDPSCSRREGKYPGSDSSQRDSGFMDCCSPLEGEDLYFSQPQLGQWE